MVQLLFFHFRVANLNLKNIKLHFELLALSRPILETLFYPCPMTLHGHQEKNSFLVTH